MVRKKLFKIRWRWYISVFFVTFLGAVIINMMLGDEKVSMALVAVGTLSLAIVTAASVDNSRQQEKRRIAEGLLKEIIEWAINIITSCFDDKTVLREMARITDVRQSYRVYHSHIAEMKERFMGLRGRNKYISKIAEKFEASLQEKVEKLITDLEAYIELLDDWQHAMADAIDKGIADIEGDTDRIDGHVEQLRESANNVIEEAVKIMPKT